ncbi:DUF721 domain-containing protein [bacterium]|nr:DUF721 domain-containing protein [bacterium]
MAQSLKNLLPSVLKQEGSWKINLLKNWPTILGNLKTKVLLEKIQDSTLVLSVNDSCWLQELYLLSPILLKTINEKLDRPRIKRLRFKQAGIKKVKTKQATRKKIKPCKPVELSSKENKALQTIDDPQLQKALKQFLVRCYHEKE